MHWDSPRHGVVVLNDVVDVVAGRQAVALHLLLGHGVPERRHEVWKHMADIVSTLK